jgi:hypothetical protein
MLHLSTIQMLREWARWGESQNINYPSMSPMFGERALKTPLFGSGHIPRDVWQVEEAVCKIAWEYRQIIIYRYQRHLTFGHIASRLHCQTRTARARVRTAEHAVHHELTEKACTCAEKHVQGA